MIKWNLPLQDLTFSPEIGFYFKAPSDGRYSINYLAEDGSFRSVDLDLEAGEVVDHDRLVSLAKANVQD